MVIADFHTNIDSPSFIRASMHVCVAQAPAGKINNPYTPSSSTVLLVLELFRFIFWFTAHYPFRCHLPIKLIFFMARKFAFDVDYPVGKFDSL
jgi:hypothetical protein